MLPREYFGELSPNEVLCEPAIIKASNVLEWDKERGFSTYVWEIPKDSRLFLPYLLEVLLKSEEKA